MIFSRYSRNFRVLASLAALTIVGLGAFALRPDASFARAGRLRINAAAPDTTFADMQGKTHSLRGINAPAVYLFLSTECPIANLYTPRILALEKAYRAKGVRFFGVYAQAADTPEAVQQHVRERKFTFPIVREPQLAAQLGATVTPQAIMLDRQGVLRYRGRIDDNKDASRVASRDLKLALDAVLAGKTVRRPETAAMGCALVIATPRPVARPTVTYTKDIAPILNDNCVACHRTGEVAPFTLENYKQARNWATQVKLSVAARRMPPWKADSQGEFHDERRLTPAQIAAISAWADAGAPEGNPADLPPAPAFLSKPAGAWKLGEPDLIVEMPETYTVAPDGRDVYRCFVIPTELDDRWVSAVEVIPGNRRVVHHAIAYLDKSGKARELDAKADGPGYNNPTPGNLPGFLPAGLLAAWVPGQEPRHLPEGVGNKMPAKSDIVLEVHYHPNGKVETDRTRLGIYFSKGPIKKRLTGGGLINRTFLIPAGARDHVVRATTRVGQDVTVLALGPHMHLIGKSAKITATFPDGKKQVLLDVNEWDFNWQLAYWYKNPLKLPKGTQLDLETRYDNSASNPKNPNRPPKPMKWGEQSTDEMCLAALAWTLDSEDLTASQDKPTENGLIDLGK